MKSLLKTAVLSLTMAVSMTAINTVQADSLADIQANKEMKFALSGAYPPFNFVGEDGELTGFDIEIGKEISKRISTQGTPVATAWDGIIAGLVANKYDAIIGSMAITDARMDTVDFSNPYYHDGAQLFVGVDSTVMSVDDLKGKAVGVTLGTTFEAWVVENAPEVEVKTYKGVPQMLLEVANGRIDGFITGKMVGLVAIKEKALPIKTAGSLLYVERIGIAIQKDNKELLDVVNSALADMQQDGSYAAISMKWFKADIR